MFLISCSQFISYFPHLTCLSNILPNTSTSHRTTSFHRFASHRIIRMRHRSSVCSLFLPLFAFFQFHVFVPTFHMLIPRSPLRWPWSRKVASRHFINTRHQSVRLRLTSYGQNTCTRLGLSLPHRQSSPVFVCRIISPINTTDRFSNQLHALRPQQCWHRPICTSSLVPRYVTLNLD